MYVVIHTCVALCAKCLLVCVWVHAYVCLYTYVCTFTTDYVYICNCMYMMCVCVCHCRLPGPRRAGWTREEGRSHDMHVTCSCISHCMFKQCTVAVLFHVTMVNSCVLGAVTDVVLDLVSETH